MNHPEQLIFIVDLVENTRKKIIKNLDKYPEKWDGIELRWLIKEHFDQVVLDRYTHKNLKKYKNFKNECIVNNLI